MPIENYKKRAGDVRRSARSDLQKIRQARMARRSALSHDVADKQALSDESAQETHTATRDDGTAKSNGSAAEQVQEFDTLDELAVKNAAMTETAELPPAHRSFLKASVDELPEAPAEQERESADLDCFSEVDAGPESGQSQDAGATDTKADKKQVTTESDLLQSELAHLPGAGPGLVWMLAQCNVQSMAQLAASDAEDLSNQLGVVGQILDVGQWIDFAKEWRTQ